VKSSNSSTARAIFLDRDGVIIRKAPEGEYISRCQDVRFIPGALDAIASFCHKGWRVLLATNQRGASLGKIARCDLDDIHALLGREISARGAALTGIYCCTHGLDDLCSCRKPGAGLLFRAARDHHLTLSLCWMIGDSASDIFAGRRAGCRTALINASVSVSLDASPDLVAPDLLSAAAQILRREQLTANLSP
jgi:D-glycero-D-manno-heptose 1,7-bisphosphate phosphatase